MRSADGPEAARIVVTGKGGVGKTTLTALLARLLARRGLRVLAVDGDAQMHLGYALGVPLHEAEAIVPLNRNADYIEEKTGARPGAGWGLLLRLNPDAEDAVDRFAVRAPDGVQLLTMGTLSQAAAGCLCPENELLGAAMSAVALREGELILLDTQAGVEHFGRALARGFGQALVVSDPTFNGVAVALQTAGLARQLGIPVIRLVLNRVRADADSDRVRTYLQRAPEVRFTSVHTLPYEEAVLAAEPSVDALLNGSPSPFAAAVAQLAALLAPA
jgi:CO dehydrogenase maturation factor